MNFKERDGLLLQDRAAIILFGIGLSLIIVSLILSFSPNNSTTAPSPSTQVSGIQYSPNLQTVPVINNKTSTQVNQLAPPVSAGPYVEIIANDTNNGRYIQDVSLYINGNFTGTTSENGTLFIPVGVQLFNVSTIRAAKDGYQDKTILTDLSKKGIVIIGLTQSSIVPIEINGPIESRINIVFLPSDTSFNATDGSKISLGGYPGGRQEFESNVRQFIANTFLEYPSLISPWYPTPNDYEKRFNFYYFWDGTTYGDAFDGCAGSIPQVYWNEVTFSDLTIILYPSYNGLYQGLPGQQPIGCTNPNGLGRVYLKIPANMPVLGMHEIGHGLYGLMDTYCSDSTYYRENDPNPNIWSSLQSCREYAIANSWDPDSCRQISSNDSGEIAGENPSLSTCTQQFWRWDPDPDIMHDGYDGTFENASTKRIITILDRISP